MSQLIQIRVDRHALRYAVPSSVFRQSEFKWRPQDVEGITAIEQVTCLTRWGDPGGAINPHVFIVTSYEQLRAEYAAAWLVGQHVKQKPDHDVLWCPLYDDQLDRYTSEFKGVAKSRTDQPSIIVATNLGLQATDVQLEKVRELWERWPSVPLIVCGYGRTPLELARAASIPMYGALHINPTREVLDV